MDRTGSLPLILFQYYFTVSQLSRLIAILTLLKSRRVLTAPELAAKFNTSVRTSYRDIQHLIAAGVPIVTLEGRGYTLMEGYTVAPVQFTEKEANALITAHHLVGQSNDSSFVFDFEEALTKIKSVFRSSILQKSELLHNHIHIFDTRQESIASNALSEIQLAITNFKYVEINYRKANDPNISFRKIEPYAIFSSDQKWVLIAWCHLRKDYRAFRIDRIQHFKILNQHFEDREFSIKGYFESYSEH